MTHSRIYKINEAFFDTLSTEMAYVLGFWFADGYMRHEKSYRVAFFSNDKDILESIREAMLSTHPIRKNKGDNCWSIIIFSRHLYESLQKFGAHRRKSIDMEFPKIPRRFIRDFIRGYFDGDGSVFIVEYLATKNHKSTKELRSNFTSGSMTFLVKLMNVLYRELGSKKKKLGVYNEGGSLKLGYGSKDTRKLLEFLYYPGHTIALQRKANFIQSMK